MQWLMQFIRKNPPRQPDDQQREWEDLKGWYLSNWQRWDSCAEREKILAENAYTPKSLATEVTRERGHSLLMAETTAILRQLRACGQAPAV